MPVMVPRGAEQQMTAAILAYAKARRLVQFDAAERAEIEHDWQLWLRRLFPQYLRSEAGDEIPFAAHHHEFWDWVWAIDKGSQPRPFVGIWARGGGKSTSVELACAALGARGARHYVLYLCESQPQADDHVSNIAAMLESATFGAAYPRMADRAVGKFGNPKGWRRNRLRTASGFTVDALGLDSAARGAKLEADRPDLLILDDIDGELDSPLTTLKKIKTITTKILPAGSGDVTVLAIQNLVHPDSVFSRLADGRAEFLSDRIVSGPHPALQHLAVEQREGRYVIVAGEPTWAGQDVDACQAKLDDMGLSAFMSECQHDVAAPPGGIFSHLTFKHCKWGEVPWPLFKVAVMVDPAVTDSDESDCFGVSAGGVTEDGDMYMLYHWEDRTDPGDAMCRAILKAIELGADQVGVETNQGGDLWQGAYKAAWAEVTRDMLEPPPPIAFRPVKADASTGGKVHRASAVLLPAYERGKVTHVLGTHETIERALRRFPRTPPHDLVDATVWLAEALGHGRRKFIRV